MKTSLLFTILFLTVHFVFSQWTQLGQDIDGEAAGDLSGQSVSMSSDGSIVAIGASGNDANGNNSGHVRVYQFNGTSWNQLGQDIDGGGFGRSVSLSADGQRLAVGAPLSGSSSGFRSGHVMVYQFNGLSWNQIGQNITGEGAEDRSGQSVSLSADGSRLAIGAYFNDGNGNLSGHVRVYQFTGSQWAQWGQDIDGEAGGDRSGLSISLSADGSRLAVGAHFNSGNGNLSGHVRIYEHDGVSWNQLGQDIDGEVAGDQSGISVSLSADGSIVAIGARANSDNGNWSGHVRVYQFDGASWSQMGQDLDGEAANDWSGSSVSLSGDGSRLAVGALYNDGNGNGSGHTRIYEYDGAVWNQMGEDIDGEAAVDQSGVSVSLSGDGSRLAIGALENDGNGSNSGHVRVYTDNTVDYTAVPDPNFEQALINQGIDSEGILDGQVLTEDISGLTTLDVANSSIADLSGIEDFTALETLHCHDNLLTALNVTQNPALVFLSCYNNLLTALDVTQNPDLSTLWTADNLLTALDVTQNPGITDLRCFNNQLTALDVTQNPDLTSLYCYDNQLTALDVTQNNDLTILYTERNQLTALDVTQNPNLLQLLCDSNQLATLDVTQNPGLIYLYCYDNQLTALDVTQNPALTQLLCYGNQLLALDVTQNPNLTDLRCYSNQLTALDVTQNSGLTTLWTAFNQLTALDLSQNPALTSMYCQDNPMLSCIEVANAADADAGAGIYAAWVKDDAASYSEDCGIMARGTSVPGTKNTKVAVESEEEHFAAGKIVLYPNPASKLLYVVLPGEKELASVTLYNAQGRQVGQTKSTVIDTTQLPAGLYLVTIRLSNGKRITKKIIVSGE